MHVATLVLVVVTCVSSLVGTSTDSEVVGFDPETSTEPASNETADDAAISVAVKDVAYYLRAHKFNEYDRRFYETYNETSRTLYASFPDPPLLSLHWEIRKSCDPGFDDCLKYLHETVLQTEQRRLDDTATIAREHNWTMRNNSAQIEAVDKECVRLRDVDNVGAQPFQGPLERFQWRTTASYYMCWYTMKRIPALTLFGEPCDNFASCLDPTYGVSNEDPRADDRLSFHCAAYSFCPDACCPVRHVTSLDECRELPRNPCAVESPEEARTCSLKSAENDRDVRALALGRWNTSCACARTGFEWNARFGMCVDVDECARGTDTCDRARQACFNLPGAFECGCKWGFLFDARQGECVRAGFLVMPETRLENVTEKEMSASIIKMVANKLFPAKATASVVDRGSGATVLELIIATLTLLLQTL